MMARYPIRVRIGVLLVLLFAVLSSGLGLRRALEPPDEDIGRYEARFRLLKSALPPEGVVGYLSEPRRFDEGAYRSSFYLTQYALAPVVVVDSTAPALVIGNFRSAGPGRKADDLTLVLVRDFGDGVLLLRHPPR